jgi:hypothetical protein
MRIVKAMCLFAALGAGCVSPYTLGNVPVMELDSRSGDSAISEKMDTMVFSLGPNINELMTG